MFGRKKKYYLALSDNELRLVRQSLLRLRNKLIVEGRCADPVNELLMKLANF